MVDQGRARRMAGRIRQIVATYLEMHVKDPRLGMVTITDVRVTGDLHVATLFYTVYGDEAAWADTAAALEKGIQPGFHHTPVDGVRSIARVKELAAEKDADIFFSHDMEAWQGYKHAPEAYEL